MSARRALRVDAAGGEVSAADVLAEFVFHVIRQWRLVLLSGVREQLAPVLLHQSVQPLLRPARQVRHGKARHPRRFARGVPSPAPGDSRPLRVWPPDRGRKGPGPVARRPEPRACRMVRISAIASQSGTTTSLESDGDAGRFGARSASEPVAVEATATPVPTNATSESHAVRMSRTLALETGSLRHVSVAFCVARPLTSWKATQSFITIESPTTIELAGEGRGIDVRTREGRWWRPSGLLVVPARSAWRLMPEPTSPILDTSSLT